MKKIIFLFLIFLICFFSSQQFEKSKNKVGIKQQKDSVNNEISEIEYYKGTIKKYPFEKYTVTDFYTSRIVSLNKDDFKELPKEIFDNIQSQYNQILKPNFAGKYVIVSWGGSLLGKCHFKYLKW